MCLTDMSKLLWATPDIDIYMTHLYLSINGSMAPIMWRTIVEITDDYAKSTLVQVVDWCRQVPEPTSTKFYPAISRDQAIL